MRCASAGSPLLRHDTTSGLRRKSQQVLIRYAAYRYQKFGMGNGEVVAVSQSPYVVQELPTHVAATMQAVAQGSDPVYRVTVKSKAKPCVVSPMI